MFVLEVVPIEWFYTIFQQCVPAGVRDLEIAGHVVSATCKHFSPDLSLFLSQLLPCSFLDLSVCAQLIVDEH